MVEPLMGRESCYNLPEGSLIIRSQDLMYTHDRGFLNLMEQAAVAPKTRTILTLLPAYRERDLVAYFEAYNLSHPANMVRKIVSREGG